MSTQLSQVRGEPFPAELPSLWERFNRNVLDFPENIALVCTHQAPDLYSLTSTPLDTAQYRQNPYLRWTYQTLKTAVERMVDLLQSSGIKEGTPLVTLLHNGAEWPVTFLAANYIGCVVAPINPRNLSNSAETTHMLDTIQSVSPDQPIAFVAGSVDIATQIDTLVTASSTTKIVASSDNPDGWIPFQSIIHHASRPESKVNLSDDFTKGMSARLVLFTSGTTSLPKGCCWTADAFSSFLAMREGMVSAMQPGDKCCIVVPNNHALGCALMGISFSAGSANVYSGPAFVPGAMMSALRGEECTHTCLVPTMIHGLTSVLEPGQTFDKLKNIILGGSLVTPEALYTCINKLGAAGVENGYGMTEGLLICSGNHRDPSKIIKANDVSVGWIGTGSAAKVCAPDATTPLPRNTAGELHFSGRSLCKGYIGRASDNFYTDQQGVPWLITGDQAIIDEEGRIYVVGRYKDMIIRGAENISPAAIEYVLGKVPKLAALDAQIVGTPDPIAGEIPVAVVRGDISSELSAELQNVVIKQMGTIYAPDEIISLQSLGLTDYPRTMAGKIQKAKLVDIVRKYRDDREAASMSGSNDHLKDTIKTIWARAVGRDPQQLSLDSQISDFADSITVMRVRDKIKRETGKSLSMSEMANAGTLAEHIKLLESLTADIKPAEPKMAAQRDGPPLVEDMAHLIEDPELFDATKSLVQRTISPFGFEWNDVADILPAYDFATVLANTGIFDTWNIKMAILPTKSDAKRLRQAFDMMLRVNPMLSSFLVWDESSLESDIALHVTVKHSQKVMSQAVQDGGTLKTLDDLKALTLKYPFPSHATFPGLLFRAIIYEVEEVSSAAVILNMNHAVIDASYGQIVLEDLDHALAATNPKAHSHVDYKLWADSYYSLRSSPTAKAATKWHVKRLRGLNTHQKATFPPIPDRKPWDPALEVEEEDGFQYSFEAPDFPKLRQAHRDITAPIALKAALALLNVQRTGHSHALFSNLEAARTTYPFVPKSMESQFEATDVAGPTIEAVINLIEIKPEESVINFLHRMQDDQSNLTKYASAPLKDIMSALGESAQMIPTTIQSQIFNWVPGMGTTGTNPHANLEMLKMVARPHVGLAVNAGLGGKESSTVFLHLRGDALDMTGLERMAFDLEKITRWMLEPAHWDEGVGGFVKCL